MGKDKTAVSKLQPAPLTTYASADLIISKLAGKDVDPEKIEKLLEIKGRFEAEENKKMFHHKFAEMQGEMPIVKKTKSVEGKYKYAPLEEIVKQIRPVLKKFGFSYRWSEGISEDKSSKRIICHIMAHGHEETNYVDIPLLQSPVNRNGKKVINDAQVSGSMSTYGKRYSLIGALGIMADEDDDAKTFDNAKRATPEPPKITPEMQDKIEELEQLAMNIKLNAAQEAFICMAHQGKASMKQIQTSIDRIKKQRQDERDAINADAPPVDKKVDTKAANKKAIDESNASLEAKKDMDKLNAIFNDNDDDPFFTEEAK